MSDSARQFREPQPRPPRKRNRLMTIARRAQYLTGAWLGHDPGSMIRELDDGEIAERKRLGAAAGAAWVANTRGILR